jgi:ATP-dependent DNA helicase RecQ
MNAIIKSYKHHLIEAFGSGLDKDDKFWSAVIRQGQIHGLIDKNIENYGLLSVSDEGLKYIEKPFSIRITEDHNFDDVDDEDTPIPPMGKGGSADDELFGMLKDLRKKVAKRNNLPPFVIFQDPSLEDMSIQYPITFEELQNITGVGAGKAKKFGGEFLELIKAYVEEKDIIRPQDMVVKSVVNRSGNKVFIIQSIDRQMDLEDIADARSLAFDELLSEIEVIVNSGTRLNLDYYINMNIDEDKIDDIYEYFKEDAESDSIDEAVKELGREYTEEEIRLVRIKFICEQGN